MSVGISVSKNLLNLDIATQEPGLGRQEGRYLLGVLLHDVHRALQLGQHGIIELGQLVPAHLEGQRAPVEELGHDADLTTI